MLGGNTYLLNESVVAK